MFDFASIVADAAREPAEPLRLRDLVAGLRSGEIGAQAFMDRLDPALADEINAVALHRGVTTENFVVGALLAFALDAADEAWRRLEGRGGPGDGEARAFEALMRDAVRRSLERDGRIGADAKQTSAKQASPGTTARRIAAAD